LAADTVHTTAASAIVTRSIKFLDLAKSLFMVSPHRRLLSILAGLSDEDPDRASRNIRTSSVPDALSYRSSLTCPRGFARFSGTELRGEQFAIAKRFTINQRGVARDPQTLAIPSREGICRIQEFLHRKLQIRVWACR
jgi:hypothetical protein